MNINHKQRTPGWGRSQMRSSHGEGEGGVGNDDVSIFSYVIC